MADKEFDWKRYQEYMGNTDEELEIMKSDPVRANATKKLFTREMAKKCLVIEVVSSHACMAGMKVGDRLVFKGLGVLDTERSSPWCAMAMGVIPSIANMAQDRYVAGLDPNDMIYKYFSCADVGPKYGWGQITMKAYVVDESDLPKN